MAVKSDLSSSIVEKNVYFLASGMALLNSLTVLLTVSIATTLLLFTWLWHCWPGWGLVALAAVVAAVAWWALFREFLEQVTEILETRSAEREARNEETALDPEVLATLKRMRDLAMLLRKKRFKRGALELTMPEAVLEYDRDGRVSGAHFGTYDYTASLGITAAHQHMRHPACDLARGVMQAALAGSDVWLSDGATNVLPIGKDRAGIHAAWKLHADQVRHSLVGGFYQGWDLHPAQLAVLIKKVCREHTHAILGAPLFDAALETAGNVALAVLQRLDLAVAVLDQDGDVVEAEIFCG